MRTATSARIPQLDGFRAAAFLAVYLNHALNVPFLWIGVGLFFVLSGYLITGLLLSEAEYLDLATLLRSFYTRRAFRILIPYAVLMVLVTAFVESKWLAFWPYYVFFSHAWGDV
jgi:peptidoglycan/LPS O-acetylase OafA/YrhL